MINYLNKININMKLISMTDFVISNQRNDQSDSHAFFKCVQYANFLKQPLALAMFVPCDDDGNILSEPKFFYTEENIKKLKGVEIEIALAKNKEVENYKNAKSKGLFKGFYLDETYKREKLQLPYLTNGKISVFLHSDFAIRHQLIEDLVDFNLDINIYF